MGRTRLQSTPLDSCLNLRTPEPMVNPRIQPFFNLVARSACRRCYSPPTRGNSLRPRATYVRMALFHVPTDVAPLKQPPRPQQDHGGP
jgi:hypothetical protein